MTDVPFKSNACIGRIKCQESSSELVKRAFATAYAPKGTSFPKGTFQSLLDEIHQKLGDPNIDGTEYAQLRSAWREVFTRGNVEGELKPRKIDEMPQEYKEDALASVAFSGGGDAAPRAYPAQPKVATKSTFVPKKGWKGAFVAKKLAAWKIPDDAVNKIPKSWGNGSTTKKGVGMRWEDPNNPGNGVRIDQGNPNNSQEIQQSDHVLVRSGGNVIGRDGKPIPGSIDDHPELAHIPLSEYQKWTTWNHP